MQQKHVDFGTAVALLILSFYVISESIRFHNEFSRRIATVFHQSPGFFPFMIGIALLVCAVLLLIRSLKDSSILESAGKIKSGVIDFLKSPATLKAFVGCAWMGVYIYILLPALNFLVGSIIFLVVFISFLQAGTLIGAGIKTVTFSVLKTVTISVLSIGAIYSLFQLFFRVPLP